MNRVRTIIGLATVGAATLALFSGPPAAAAPMGDATTSAHWIFVQRGCQVGGGQTTRANVSVWNRQGVALFRIKARVSASEARRVGLPGRARNAYATTAVHGPGAIRVYRVRNPRGTVLRGPTRTVGCYLRVTRRSMTPGYGSEA